MLREVDEVFINAIKEWGLYDKIWQAFAVFLPVRSVGELLWVGQGSALCSGARCVENLPSLLPVRSVVSCNPWGCWSGRFATVGPACARPPRSAALPTHGADMFSCISSLFALLQACRATSGRTRTSWRCAR